MRVRCADLRRRVPAEGRRDVLLVQAVDPNVRGDGPAAVRAGGRGVPGRRRRVHVSGDRGDARAACGGDQGKRRLMLPARLQSYCWRFVLDEPLQALRRQAGRLLCPWPRWTVLALRRSANGRDTSNPARWSIQVRRSKHGVLGAMVEWRDRKHGVQRPPPKAAVPRKKRKPKAGA